MAGLRRCADEVRRLAEQSATAAAEAGEVVQDIHTQVGEVVEQMRRGQVNVGDVEELSRPRSKRSTRSSAATAEATAHAGRITAAPPGTESGIRAPAASASTPSRALPAKTASRPTTSPPAPSRRPRVSPTSSGPRRDLDSGDDAAPT